MHDRVLRIESSGRCVILLGAVDLSLRYLLLHDPSMLAVIANPLELGSVLRLESEGPLAIAWQSLAIKSERSLAM